MVSNFFIDLDNARGAEYLVKEELEKRAPELTFENVGDQREYFYKGDIKATAADGTEIFIEVKDDSRIADTHNVLCEYKVYYAGSRRFGRGNMDSECDYLAIRSKSENLIYIIDFNKLKTFYKKGLHKIIYHSEQDTYCYLVKLDFIKEMGAFIAALSY